MRFRVSLEAPERQSEVIEDLRVVPEQGARPLQDEDGIIFSVVGGVGPGEGTECLCLRRSQPHGFLEGGNRFVVFSLHLQGFSHGNPGKRVAGCQASCRFGVADCFCGPFQFEQQVGKVAVSFREPRRDPQCFAISLFGGNEVIRFLSSDRQVVEDSGVLRQQAGSLAKHLDCAGEILEANQGDAMSMQHDRILRGASQQSLAFRACLVVTPLRKKLIKLTAATLILMLRAGWRRSNLFSCHGSCSGPKSGLWSKQPLKIAVGYRSRHQLVFDLLVDRKFLM